MVLEAPEDGQRRGNYVNAEDDVDVDDYDDAGAGFGRWGWANYLLYRVR